MTPKEKAKELVDSFYNAQVKILNKETSVIVEVEEAIAKQCALICVNNIIGANPHSNPFNTDVYSTMDYWQEVKQEIEKL